jgi:hypothetical protein
MNHDREHEIAALREELARVEEADFINSMSDDFAFTNGSHAALLKRIREIKAKINELEGIG